MRSSRLRNDCHQPILFHNHYPCRYSMSLAAAITQGFALLKRILEIAALQAATASTRQQTVRGAVESRMDVLGSFLTGSYKRSTMIAPLALADIEVLVVLQFAAL